MFQAVLPPHSTPRARHELAAAGSRLFSELLDTNHDAWRVFRDGPKWTFYREVGGRGSRAPLGAVVITSEPGKPQTCDFYSARGKRSLLTTYGDEVPRAAQTLIERERVITLFSKLASSLDAANWDHNLSFCGVAVLERRVQLRSGTRAFQQLVGDVKGRMTVSPSGGFRALPTIGTPGISVSEHEGTAPYVQCSITYPRPLNVTFFSSRLREGVHAITDRMVSMVVEHNRSVQPDR